MADPITLKGIQRNASKLAVEDGRAEDLINLRFKDGSWRTAGDGKHVFAMTNETTGVVYEQLYIHTNASYHHILGVNPTDSKLYWFANIGNDGETFTALTTPQEICSIEGDLYINQTGHLITIIDGEDDFEYAVFKTGDEVYKVLGVDSNGPQNNRSLYPFDVKFNLQLNNDSPYSNYETQHRAWEDGQRTQDDAFYHNKIIPLFDQAKNDNRFTGAFLIIAAVELYDGTYSLASNLIYLCPRERITPVEGQSTVVHADSPRQDITIPSNNKVAYYGWSAQDQNVYQAAVTDVDGNEFISTTPHYPVVTSGQNYATSEYAYWSTYVFWSDLLCTLDTSVLKNNSDIFKSFCIFITKPSEYLDLTINKGIGQKSRVLFADKWNQEEEIWMTKYAAAFYPFYKSRDQFIYDIVNSPLFLLKRYSMLELTQLENNPLVDLTKPNDLNVLNSIVDSDTLTYESQSRMTYIPHVAYNYNGKLHIADYKSIQFHGYPLESFMLHNRSLKVQQGSTYEGLPNLADNNNEYYQYTSNKVVYTDTPSGTPTEGVTEISIPSEFRTEHVPLAFAIVDIDTGESQPQRVVRHIETPATGDITLYPLNPLISFPDIRAKEMTICFFQGKILDMFYSYGYYSVLLNPHPYINSSYYLARSLKPLSVTSFPGSGSYSSIDRIKNDLAERYIEERFPNGLKVSQTNNPFYFPVEQAYQIGNGTIIALCSNAISVGTGQTGAAPLYVFCTDGIYALYVDASGEMAYTNARIIARDVCNNAKSVTPIDTGVAFTTDRGLMEIAGDVVNEIGQPAEGDVVEYTKPDWAKPRNVGKNILTKVANLPLTLVDGVDFLSYLRGAIINYNHNERELMVSNPDYPYSYVLDRYSNWSRRDYSADEYVNNYPTSYRVKDGVFYKVDAEQDGLEGKSEAPNDFLYLSNVIKLGSVDFKKAYRFVVRGKFNTNNGTENKTLGVYVFGSYDGRQFAMLGANEKKGTFTDIGCKIERTDVKYFRVGLAGHLSGDSRIDFMEIEGEQSNLTTKLR